MKKWDDKAILIVEDDKISFEYLKAALRPTDVKILHANTGLEAVEMVEKGEAIDLVLMDIRLPEMSGFDATRRIKKKKPKLPVIAQTAYALPEDKEKCMDAGCDAVLVKPILRSDIFFTISHYLDPKDKDN